ncbi:MarR family transcriptional regulator [Aliiroseovarius subalbicans]|uniref:MarR family winged helix-turn-helix transcriptional regulator n=1 Tax=Aliiroseovarius subalbicans TaxID=2925840 RepID=UPI001F59AE85|nr:MarR family transcriptional regulator [Aliiroseovarius subalbicans]MCI2398459.1 MarR family transcriptional regulator [Aliiroseovarius subalbicans]
MTKTTTLSAQANETRTGSAGWMIQVLSNRLGEQLRGHLADLDLTQDQFIVMMTLAEGDGVNQTEIGKRVRLKNYTVTRVLDALEARGLVERQADKTSRRAHLVVLTGEGQALMPRLFEIVKASNAGFLSALSKKDQVEFLRLLTQLVQA